MDEDLYDIIRTDPRYALEAYEFACDAVGFTQETLGRIPQEDDDPDADYHISGPELVRGMCELAVQDFGMMAWIVFKQWGVTTTGDLGNIVFNLIKAKKLSQSDNDDIEDFQNLFDIRQFFDEEFEMDSGIVSSGKGSR